MFLGGVPGFLGSAPGFLVFWGVFPVLGGVPGFLGVPVFLAVLHALKNRPKSRLYITLFRRRNKPQNVLNISRDTSNMASDTLST